MKPTLSSKMVAKAQAAMTSAVEVYNRPSFAYREETFAILSLNAWELLLKSQIVRNGGESPKAIWIFAPKKKPDGSSTKKLYVKRNRTGNPMTFSVRDCLNSFTEKKTPIDPHVAANIEALVAIRDNATHYFAASSVLAEKTAQIASATVKNFVTLARDWFGVDFSHNFTLCLPLAFISGPATIEAVVTKREKRLLDYIGDLAAIQEKDSDYAVALRLVVKFEKGVAPDAIKVQYSKDPDAVPVYVSEEDARKTHPWDYADLTGQLRKRHPQFLENSAYHAIRKPLEKEPKFARVRELDPGNPKSPKKKFYNPNILAEFAKHYGK